MFFPFQWRSYWGRCPKKEGRQQTWWNNFKILATNPHRQVAAQSWSSVCVYPEHFTSNYTCKIWRLRAGFWLAKGAVCWVWMFLRVRTALGGTELGACLHLVASSSSWSLSCVMGQAGRSNSSCSLGAVQLTGSLLLRRKEVQQGNSGLWWQAKGSAGGHTSSADQIPQGLSSSFRQVA